MVLRHLKVWLLQAVELQLVLLLACCLTHCQLTTTSVRSSSNIHHVYCAEPAVAPGTVPFRDWSFSNKSPLLELPIDPEEKNYVRKVHNVSFSRVMPTPFRSLPVLAALSRDVLQNLLDLDPCDCAQSRVFLALASGGQPQPPNSLNLAHRYGGHQFGHWAGQLGDGRAVLVGSYLNRMGGYWEAQLKGSGKTPYSRDGDGRAVLRSSIREFLASEAMHALGVPTSRAASLVTSDDAAWRDQFYDGHPRQEPTAVVLRLAPSWFRIGSLEILHRNKEFELLRQTVDLVTQHYYPELVQLHNNTSSSRYAALFARVVNETAEMIARWQSVGFTHGVCNTDNFSLLSLTIDYGPFGFMEKYDPDFVPNTSDDEGMYRFKYQPSVGHHNLVKLWETLKPLVTERSDRDTMHEGLMLYAAAFNNTFLGLMSEKLGLEGVGDEEETEMLVAGLLQIMEDVEADFTMTFRELSETTVADLVTDTLPGHTWALPRLLAHSAWRGWLRLYHSLTLRCATDSSMERVASYSEGMRMERMQGVNSRYVLRNWMTEEAIRRAEDEGDFSVVHRLQRVLQNPYLVQHEAEVAGYALQPPQWAQKLRVSCSS
jgi:uncharacterized protein YdiU (UPF0061 family)